MDGSVALVKTSLAGSIELFALCAGGAILARKNILDKAACSSWSKAIFNLFLPCLLFNSILQTILNAKKTAVESKIIPFQLFIPPIWACITLIICGIVAHIFVFLFMRDVEEGVRRVVFASLLLGNANSLPILLIKSLCENYQPLQQEGNCGVRGTSYVALYLVAWNSCMWTFVLSYIMNTPDAAEDGEEEEHFLDERPETIREVERAESPSSVLPMSFGGRSESCVQMSRRDLLLSPPFLAIVSASLLAIIPMVAELYISENAALKPVKRAVDLLGSVVIPGSSLIVGGRLYAFRNAVSGQKCVGNGSKLRFQTISGMMILGLVLTRFVILGFAGRIAFKILGFSYFVHDPLLRIYMIFPYFMPTASNIVVMVQMAGGNLPNVGDRMEHALLTLMFWQYVTAPLFLSANVALDIVLAYGERGM